MAKLPFKFQSWSDCPNGYIELTYNNSEEEVVRTTMDLADWVNDIRDIGYQY